MGLFQEQAEQAMAPSFRLGGTIAIAWLSRGSILMKNETNKHHE
ncbi:hypothetical protein DFP83_10243 [Idiomarina fontislapidosi]|nr:hypothetical protein DFP83_10243 [Idiomarina fontislapidosi]